MTEAASGPGVRIFINYRRDDTAGHAGRLYDSLVEEFGDGSVFMDIDTIDPGEDFVEVIHEGVGSCDVVLSLIGRGWLASKDAKGRRRLDNAEDFVRLELETALERGIRIVPVLVQGAEMPSSEELPQELTGLARRNALDLSDGRWAYDVGRLITAIGRVAADKARRLPAGEAPGPPVARSAAGAVVAPPPPPPPTVGTPVARAATGGRGGRRAPLLIGAVVLAVLLVAGLIFILTRGGGEEGAGPTTSTTPSTTVPSLSRTEVFRQDFEADLTHWGATQNADCSWQPVGGAYRIAVATADHLCWSTTIYDDTLAWSDVSVEADATVVTGSTVPDAAPENFSGGAQGLICRQVGGNEFYQAAFHANGDWLISKRAEAATTTLAQGNAGSLSAARNAVRLDCTGDAEVRIVLSVNGVVVGEGTDRESPYGSGFVGVIVTTAPAEGDYAVDFDNLVASVVEAGA